MKEQKVKVEKPAKVSTPKAPKAPKKAVAPSSSIGGPQNKRFKMSLTARQAWTGRLFALPFYIGFAVFFFWQVAQSLWFSFCEVTVDVTGIHAPFVGLDQYEHIFLVDADFSQTLVKSLTQLAWKVPVIIVASLFIAVILKSKFVGRTFVRGVCFLPVVLATGIVMDIVNTDTISRNVMSGNMVSSGSMVDTNALGDLLVNMGLGDEITKFINMIYSNLFGVLWESGVQMIIFLAALQSIPPSLYEASAIEGATGWEDFWKITIPMIGPMIMLNIFYTIVESSISTNNAVMEQVMAEYYRVNLDLSAAMSWVYFAIIAVVLGIVAFLFRKVNVKS